MSNELEQRLGKMEGVRDIIIDSLIKTGIEKLGEKELSLLEKTVSNGAKIAIQHAQHKLNTESEKGEEDYRRQATALLRAQREELNRRAQKAKEAQSGGQEGVEPLERSLPEVPTRTLGENEGLQGQFQLDYDVLSGAKPFDPSKARTDPSRE